MNCLQEGTARAFWNTQEETEGRGRRPPTLRPPIKKMIAAAALGFVASYLLCGRIPKLSLLDLAGRVPGSPVLSSRELVYA
jgi:hypothetical protein